MATDSRTPGPVEERIVAWLLLTLAAVVTGFFTLVFAVGAGMSGDGTGGYVALVFLLMTGLLFGISLGSLFWHAPSGAVRFGIGYLLVLGVVVTVWMV